MRMRLGIILVLLLSAAGCGYIPYDPPSPILGIVADANLKVVEILPQSAADGKGIEVGDTLVDLAWIPRATPMPTQSGTPATNSQPISAIALPTQPLYPEDYVEKAPIPFPDRQRINSLVAHGYPLRLRFQRNGEIFEIDVLPNITVFSARRPSPNTPTPLPDTYYYY